MGVESVCVGAGDMLGLRVLLVGTNVSSYAADQLTAIIWCVGELRTYLIRLLINFVIGFGAVSAGGS